MTNQDPAGVPQDSGFGGPPIGQNPQNPSYALPKKARKKWPWVVGGILLFLVVAVGGCSAYFIPKFFDSPAGTGTTFVTNMQVNNESSTKSAYESLCSSSKSSMTLEEFRSEIAPQQQVKGFEIDETSATKISSDAEEETFAVSYNFTDGSTKTVIYPLVKEDGKWKVCDPPPLS